MSIRASFSQERMSYLEEDGKLSTDQTTAEVGHAVVAYYLWILSGLGEGWHLYS